MDDAADVVGADAVADRHLAGVEIDLDLATTHAAQPKAG